MGRFVVRTKLTLAGLTLAASLAASCTASVGNPQGPAARRAEPQASRVLRHFGCLEVELEAAGVACLGSLEPKIFEVRANAYRVTFEGDRAVAFEKSSAGKKTHAPSDQPVRFELVYQGQQISEVRHISFGGRLLFRQLVEQQGARLRYVDANGQPLLTKSFNVVDRKLDAEGHEIEIAHFDHQDKAREDADGVHRYAITRDKRGFIVEVSVFAIDGSKTAGGDGAHRRILERDAEGRELRVLRFDRDLQPLDATWWGAVREHSYNAQGNPEREVHKDARGTVLWQKVLSHDARGVLKEIKTIDAKDALLMGPEGYARVAFGFDKEGRISERVLYSGDNQQLGPRVLFMHDGRGRLVEERSVDADGKLELEALSARIRYDENDNEIERGFFDHTGKRAQSGVGFAAYRLRYDEQNRPLEMRYLDAELRTQKNPLGIAVFRFDYQKDELLGDVVALAADGTSLDIVQFDDIVVGPSGSSRTPPFRQRSKEDARARAQQARDLLVKGARFDDVASLFDDRSILQRRRRELRIVAADKLRDPLKSALLAAPLGGYTGVLEMNGSFFVAKREQ